MFAIVSFGGSILRLLHWTAAPAWMLEFVLPMLMLYIYFQLREIQDERAERLRVREEARRPREED